MHLYKALLLILIAPGAFALDFKESFDLLPNSLSYQTAQSSTALNLRGSQNLNVKTKSFNNDRGEVSQFASRLQLKKIRNEAKKFFSVNWGPTGSFAYYPFAIESGDVFFSETDFQIMRALVGYGPEARINFEFGSFLLSASPGVQYSWVSWSSPISAGTFNRFETSLLASAQFLKPLTKNIFLQVFSDWVMEDTQTWEKAMTSSQGFPVDVKQVNTATFGVSIGYNWN